MSLSALLSFITVAIKVPPNCEDSCQEVFWQVGLTVMTHFVFHAQYCIYLIGQVEFYPVMARSVGIGSISLIGALGTVLTQILFVDSEELGINPFLLRGIIFSLSGIVYFWMPETLGVESGDYIREVEEELEEKERAE